MRSEAQGRAASRTCNKNGGSEQVLTACGGRRGGGLYLEAQSGHSKRKDSAEGAVVVVFDAHPPRTTHTVRPHGQN
jgi:hypothetical protein